MRSCTVICSQSLRWDMTWACRLLPRQSRALIASWRWIGFKTTRSHPWAWVIQFSKDSGCQVSGTFWVAGFSPSPVDFEAVLLIFGSEDSAAGVSVTFTCRHGSQRLFMCPVVSQRLFSWRQGRTSPTVVWRQVRTYFEHLDFGQFFPQQKIIVANHKIPSRASEHTARRLPQLPQLDALADRTQIGVKLRPSQNGRGINHLRLQWGLWVSFLTHFFLIFTRNSFTFENSNTWPGMLTSKTTICGQNLDFCVSRWYWYFRSQWNFFPEKP